MQHFSMYSGEGSAVLSGLRRNFLFIRFGQPNTSRSLMT
jgi:hypothetical protein